MFRLTATYAPWQEAGDSNSVVYVAECELGRGVFARRAIRKGGIILAFGGPLIDFAETRRRGPRECMAFQVGPDQYIDTLPPGVFANHSCAPNAGIQNDRDLTALRDIPPGEEIRYDYSTTMDEKSFTMRCRCGAPGCRRVVTDFSELPAEAQEFYVSRGLVMSFIVQRLRGATLALTRRRDAGLELGLGAGVASGETPTSLWQGVDLPGRAALQWEHGRHEMRPATVPGFPVAQESAADRTAAGHH